ncbi:protein FAM32A-like [Neocloeon triangulifer]|uniref:protein FAM32A-like n=1 Tax=Neocloeon triangulifer TaxID=2078957 RepID=UPI00286F141A|nr:protein FAM32A-like [Neocloeon triangulifer]XP_059476629.1 protein FAM32A-like [Neocloeon triangulifer]
MDDDYAAFAGGKLKIKKNEGVESASKKKKKKDKEKKRLDQKIQKVVDAAKSSEDDDSKDGHETSNVPTRRYTKAELAFKKQQEKIQNERINNKAMKTHKQRVEEFNRHLDNLTEHFDIPKVSWTK